MTSFLSNLTESIYDGTLPKRLFRKVSFPNVAQAVVECLMFGCVFLAAAYVSLDFGIQQMLPGLVPLVVIMMASMVISGVYRAELTSNIMKVYFHSLYGFGIALLLILLFLNIFMPQFVDTKFIVFFVFFAFFVTGTVRPLISGTDFMDGGGRRIN